MLRVYLSSCRVNTRVLCLLGSDVAFVITLLLGRQTDWRGRSGRRGMFKLHNCVPPPGVCLHIIAVSHHNIHGPCDSGVAFSCVKGHPGGNQVDGFPPALSHGPTLLLSKDFKDFLIFTFLLMPGDLLDDRNPRAVIRLTVCRWLRIPTQSLGPRNLAHTFDRLFEC